MKKLFMQAKNDILLALFLVQGFTVSVLFLASLSLLVYGSISQ